MYVREKEWTPFLHHMKWDKHMADIQMSEAEQNSATWPDELGYYELAKVVDDYIAQGMDISWNHNNHAWVWKHLAQGAHLSPNAYESHRHSMLVYYIQTGQWYDYIR